MQIIETKRGKGKTTWLIRQAAKDLKDGVMSCIIAPSLSDVERILLRAEQLGLYILKPLTFGQIIEGKHRGTKIEKFYIDDVDRCLTSLTRVPIEIITITGEVEP